MVSSSHELVSPATLPRWPRVARLAAPALVAMLAQSIVSDLDLVLVGRLACPESSTAQAAIVPSFIILWLFGGSLSSIAVGTQAIVARRFAEDRDDATGAAILNATLAACFGGILLTVVALVLLPTIVAQVVEAHTVRAASQEYLSYRLLTITPMAVAAVLRSAFDGLGQTRVFMSAAIPANVIHVLLAVVLILGIPAAGVPSLGIRGAGIAGAVSGFVAPVILLLHMARRDYRTKYRPFALEHASKSVLWSLTKLSAPVAGANIITMVGYGLYLAAAGKMDVVHPVGYVAPLCSGGNAEPVFGAATSVLMGVMKLKATACMALGIATATLVGQSLGKARPVEAAQFGWIGVKIGVAGFAVIGVVELWAADSILGAITSSSVVREVALPAYRAMAILSPVIPVGLVLVYALFGAGSTVFVTVAEAVLHFLCLVPLGWLFGVYLRLGMLGYWSAMLIYMSVLALIMAAKFARGTWQSKRI